jgi:DNA-binding HxlR family transcriptional regulator
MPIKAFAEQHCSIARPLSVLGERWTFLVLREIFLGRRRFDEIQKDLGIATNVLSARLATLVDEGIVDRRPYREKPERFEYRLTEKGIDLQPIILDLMRWSDQHMPVPGGPIHKLTHLDCGHDFHPVQSCSHCGGEVHARNVKRRFGRGATRKQRQAEKRVLAELRAEREAATH